MSYLTILKQFEITPGVLNVLKTPAKKPLYYKSFASKALAKELAGALKSKIPDELNLRLDCYVLYTDKNEKEFKFGISDDYQVVDSAEEVIEYERKSFNKDMKPLNKEKGQVILDNHNLVEGDALACANKHFNNDQVLADPDVEIFYILSDKTNQSYYIEKASLWHHFTSPQIQRDADIHQDIIKRKYHSHSINELVNKLAYDYKYVAYTNHFKLIQVK